ncbi:MAG: hypothetical protein JW869_01415 [Candidatus Omnitrophica bacterium]|nr:hypothetical protein [Candidatus Omnitrophota bacterium]
MESSRKRKVFLGLSGGILVAAFFLYCTTRKLNMTYGLLLSLSVVLTLFYFYYSAQADLVGPAFAGYCIMMIAWAYWYANIREGRPLTIKAIRLVFILAPAVLMYIGYRIWERIRRPVLEGACQDN